MSRKKTYSLVELVDMTLVEAQRNGCTMTIKLRYPKKADGAALIIEARQPPRKKPAKR